MNLVLVHKLKHNLFFIYLKLKRKYRKLRKKPIIQVFGDSHSLLFQHELFEIHHVGPATAYKLNSENSSTKGKEKIYKIINSLDKDDNFFLFVFGEIDCRIHINKASKKLNISIKNAIENTVNSYGNFLIGIKEAYPNSNLCVFNVLPPGEQENIYKVNSYLSRRSQLKIIKQFNKMLEAFCNKHNIIFISVFNEVVDKDENRIKEYIYDPAHYNKKIVPFIIREITKKNYLMSNKLV